MDRCKLSKHRYKPKPKHKPKPKSQTKHKPKTKPKSSLQTLNVLVANLLFKESV